MVESDWLAQRFEEHRAHLRAVAYRMLGSPSEADDAVQDAWLRLSRADTNGVENLGSWLTTVVARVALDMLRSRKSRREESLGGELPERVASRGEGSDPEHDAVMADALGPALLVVLETLAPVERLAFVLHDMFAVPFEEIAPIVGRSPAAARQLASRARRRVQGADATLAADTARQREVVAAFLAASREGDFAGLLAVLDPDIVLRADAAAVEGSIGNQSRGAPMLSPEVRGSKAVADAFAGRASAARPALVDGYPGAAWAPGGKPRVAIAFAIVGEKIIGIELVADAETLSESAFVVIEG